MNRTELIEHKLKPAMKECLLHRQRLTYAAGQLEDLFPLDKHKWCNLSDREVAAIDQLLFRFIKLQDAMGQRLFPVILMLGADWREDQSFIDRLNRLEKLGVIPSASNWSELRELRNAATHEYPDKPELNAANLNQIHGALTQLGKSLEQAIDYIKGHYPEIGQVD